MTEILLPLASILFRVDKLACKIISLGQVLGKLQSYDEFLLVKLVFTNILLKFTSSRKNPLLLTFAKKFLLSDSFLVKKSLVKTSELIELSL